MNKKKIIFVLVSLLIIMPTTVVFAVTGGGTGDSGAGTGGGSGSVANSFYYQTGGPNKIKVGAYKFELAYFNKDGSREILGTVIAQGNAWSGNGYGSSAVRYAVQKVKDYYNYLKRSGVKNVRYVTSGPLVDLANYIENGGSVTKKFGNNKITSYELIKSYIETSEGFHITDESVMQRDQDENPGRYNSYGYRILIQKIQVYMIGGSFRNGFAATRKDVASDIVNDGVYNAQGINRCVQLFGLADGFARELYTETDDVHITRGTVHAGSLTYYTGRGDRYVRWCSGGGNGGEDKTPYLADWQDGLGYNILWFDSEAVYKQYDYSIDAACVNCTSNNTDNKAYIIQDTNDWDAILASKSSKNKNIKSYYSKGNGVYCREEYYVYLPNVNNTIRVEAGRFFTLNPSASDLNAVSNLSSFPNLKPIKVVKKRQCKVNTKENSGNVNSTLDSFRRKSEYTFKGQTGKISFKYNETYKDSHYNMDDLEELTKTYDEPDNYKYSINGDTLNMEVTKFYTLPSNYYQYIRKQDGLSMKVKPSAHLEYYINLGISNLPVSFNNTGDANQAAGDIQFYYELPKNDQYSLLYKAYIEDNSYLKTDNSDGNIYKQYSTGKLADEDRYLIENSACAKMFGMNGEGFKTCMEARQNNSIGDKNVNANCIVNSKITNSTKSGYSCIILTNSNPPTDSCKTEADANRLGRDWNPYNQTCCPVGTTYNPTLGKCESNNTGNTCRIENGKYYDFNGNEISKDEYFRICPNPGDGNTCRIENGKYYDFNGNEISKDEYDRICPFNLPPYCPQDDCPYGCCPSGECAPMPDGTCPGSGGLDVIYRTIDLDNPFPGQNAEQRNTGSNWCSYNIRTRKIDCKFNNNTVKNYITREKGGTKNGGKVYRENHVLYEIDLDSSTIGKIRDYNDESQHPYDDWFLNCNENGKACRSEFLRDYIGNSVSGLCSSSTNSNFYTCDKDV